MSPTLAIFSAPKPFTNPHIAMIQRNAIRSWQKVGKDVEIFLIGQEEGLAEAAVELGVQHMSEVKRNILGTPLISSMFDLVRESSSSPLLACVNTDILIRKEFLESAHAVAAMQERFLMVGQRWALDVTNPID